MNSTTSSSAKRRTATCPPSVRTIARLGYSVFPQRKDRGGYVKWGQYRSQQPSREQIRQWHKKYPNALWAVITGQETGLIVLDFDGDDGVATMAHLGLKPYVRSSSGGGHVWVEAPDFPVKSGSRVDEERFPGLDVKAEGGCATFRGTRNGSRYKLEDGRKIYAWDELPEPLQQMLVARTRDDPPEPGEVPDDFDRFVASDVLLAESLKRVKRGQARNETGFWLAAQLRDERYSQDDAWRVMQQYVEKVSSSRSHPYTLQEAYNSTVQAYSWAPRKPRRLRGLDDNSARPPLNVGNAAEMTEWLQHEVGTGPLSGMFKRGEFMVHTPLIGEEGYVRTSSNEVADPVSGEVRHDDDGPAQIRPIRHGNLAARVQYQYTCFKEKDDGSVYKAMFPVVAALTACNAIDLLPNLRRLRGVSHTPLVRADGSVFNTPGYDPESMMLYLPDSGLAVPEITDKPTRRDVKEAVALLDQMTDGFPFITEHDRANFYGALLTPLLRNIVPPPYMAGMITAPMRGSGKSLLAQILRIVHGGVLRVEMPEDAGELRKQISSILGATTGPVVEFDNVTGVFRSSVLAGMLTSAEWDDRALGTNDYPRYVNDRLWIFTGNNAAIGGDLARRIFLVSIDPKRPNPHTRTDFKIEHLAAWVEEHRSEIIAALITLIRSWVVKGMPKDNSGRSDSYAAWVSVVRGIFGNAGVPGTFAHPESSVQDGGVDDEDWAECLAAIYAVFDSEPWTVKQVLARVEHFSQAKLRVSGSEDEPGIDLEALPVQVVEKAHKVGLMNASKSLGWWMKNHKDRFAGGYVVRLAGDDGKGTNQWRVERYESS